MAFKCRRWTVANILPVAFMSSMIFTIWMLYLWLHIKPLLTGDVICVNEQVDSGGPRDLACLAAASRRGVIQAVIQQFLTAVLIICFGRAICTDPGSVPDDQEWYVEWQPSIALSPEDAGLEAESGIVRPKVKQFELKHTGARRQCKWCNRYKPDRAHHCRVCRSCVLRMDHHCPWIANCVGFRNHKYFYLLVLYSLVDCAFVIATASESMHRSLTQETQFSHRFLLVFCLTLAVMMGSLLTLFFMFHSWLMLRTTTTIEFCEKTYRHTGGPHRGSTKSIYDRGVLDNMKAVLGSNVFLWFLPVSPPDGNGLSFKVGEGVDADAAEAEISETSSLLPKQKQAAGLGFGSYDAPSNGDVKGLASKNNDSKASFTVSEDIEADDRVPLSGSSTPGRSEVAAPEVTAHEESIS